MGCGASVSKAPQATEANGQACASSTAPREDAQLIDGKALADGVIAELKAGVDALMGGGRAAPHLVVVMVGSNPASASYIKRKEEAAASCGIQTQVLKLEAETTQEALLAEVERLNADDSVHGIIVQLPLPAGIDEKLVTHAVASSKDVDGFGPVHIGNLALSGQTPLFCPCTPQGCLHMIRSTGISLRGKEAVVIGASNIVGLPMELLLLKEGCTVTVCHIDTLDVACHARRADVLVVAVGKAHLVPGDWIKPGAVVIDVGINFVDDPSKKSGKRMVGDVNFEEAKKVAGHISPVPGGVGPMTVAMLMRNTLTAAKVVLHEKSAAEDAWHITAAVKG